MDNEAAQFFKDHPKEMKVPADMQQICDDLKVCGRREMGILIKLRHKFQAILANAAKAASDKEKARLKALEEPEDEDARIDRELEETMKRMEKEKKRQSKKDKILADKSELRKKMSVIATTVIDNDEDLTLSRKLWDDLRKKGFEGVGERSDDDSDDGSEADESMDESDEEEKGEEDEDSDESVDEKQKRIAEMADQIEEQLASRKNYQMTLDRRQASRQMKTQNLIEQQRLRLEDLAEKEALDNAGLLDSEVSDLDSEDRAYKDAERADREAEENRKIPEGRDQESSGDSDPEDGPKSSGLFINPLAKKLGKADESEEWSDDDVSDNGKKSKQKAKKKDTILGKRKRKGSIDNVQDFFKHNEIEEVPANDPGTLA